jgi:cysteine desulfurase
MLINLLKYGRKSMNKESEMKLPVYMDYQATTPMDPRVLDAMMPYFTEKFGNSSSRTHKYGWDAEDAVEDARDKIAQLIGANSKEIVITSGATESNNLAIKGVGNFYKDKKNHIITVNTEHKCVINTCRHLEQKGFDVTYLTVKPNGLIDLKQLEEAITDKTLLVSIMAVNNEIGVIQPLKEIGAICRKNGVFFHTDAAQAFGKIALDVEEMNIDLMSISGHKCYGPKGIGALYVRRKPRIRIEPLIDGGGQERGMRSGTLPVPLIVGLGEAARIASEEMAEENKRIRAMAEKLKKALCDAIPSVTINGDWESRYHGNVNLSFAYIEGESMMMAIRDLAVSSGSACTSSSLEGSYVLKALGLSDELAHTSIRFGIGRFTTDEQIDFAIKTVKQNVQKLRDMSPLWEMVQEGVDLDKVEWQSH